MYIRTNIYIHIYIYNINIQYIYIIHIINIYIGDLTYSELQGLQGSRLGASGHQRPASLHTAQATSLRLKASCALKA